jgi:hypothetical protein
MIYVRSRFSAGPRDRRAKLRLGAAKRRAVRLGAAAAACLLLTATALKDSPVNGTSASVARLMSGS